jgi:hypothetical protein
MRERLSGIADDLLLEFGDPSMPSRRYHQALRPDALTDLQALYAGSATMPKREPKAIDGYRLGELGVGPCWWF